MKKDVYDKFYKKVPQDQVEKLKKFRSTHPHKHLMVNDTNWEYISGGQGKEVLLLLTGGTGIGEAMGFAFAPLESKYQMVSPTYPSVTTMGELADGIVKILEAEGINRFNILGQSFGGILAQVIAHKYPDKVNKLILSHTTTTSPPVDQAIALEKLKKIEKKEKILSFLPFGILSLIAKWKISKLIPADIEEKEFWDAYFHEMLSNIKKEALASLSKCMIDFEQDYTFARDDLANWTGKILILESNNDPFFHTSERKALKELYPQAQVHTFHGTGHLTLIVNREESLSIIGNFLQEIRRGRRRVQRGRDPDISDRQATCRRWHNDC